MLVIFTPKEKNGRLNLHLTYKPTYFSLREHNVIFIQKLA